MRKKKIIFVTKALWIGGIETALVNLLNQFNYEKYEVTLLVLHAELNLLNQINPNCRVLIADREKMYSFDEKYKYIKLYHLTEESEHPSLLHRMFMWMIPFLKWIENRQYIGYIRHLMKNESFDTCIIYSDVVAEIAIRSIYAKHFLMYYHHGAMRHVYHDQVAYKKCDKIIAVSENQAEELRKFIPSAADKIITIHNLTDIEGIQWNAAVDTTEVFDKTRFNIVTVGRISYEKGMDIAVQACAKLVEQGVANICWWIVGDGPAMPEIRTVIAKMNMDPYIKLVGMKDNPYPYVRQADLYVQPSRAESFGLTILEALILGKVVVSTETYGAKENIINGVNGLLCKTNVNDISKTLKNLLKNPEIITKLKNYPITEKCIKENKRAMNKLERIL